MIGDFNYWLQDATKRGYAVPHFNTWNAEMLMGVMDAAEEADAPVIISFGTGFINNVIYEEFAPMMLNMAVHANVPTMVHWDHGRSFDIVLNAYENGCTSVMRDASGLPFEENVEETKRVVDFYHPRGLAVEGELGHVGDPGDYLEVLKTYKYTDPNEAAEFVERTGCDALAVAIGNVHGPYSAPPQINFDVLEKVAAEVDVPLVLHGASGISNPDVRKAISMGVAKVNIHAELGQAAMAAIKEDLDTNFVNTQIRVREAIKRRALEKFDLLGATGKAASMPRILKTDLGDSEPVEATGSCT